MESWATPWRKYSPPGNHTLTVFDIEPARTHNLVALGACSASSIADAVAGADVVFTSLPGPKQTDDAASTPDGLFATLSPGGAWIDLSTNNLETCKRLSARAETDELTFMDAPVSGADEGARAGTLTVLVGAETETFERDKPPLEHIGKAINHVGPVGAGYSAKIAQVVLCYLHSLSLSEALMLGVSGGVEPKQMLGIIQSSSGRTYVADRYRPPIIAGDYDPSFTVGRARKDMQPAMEMAKHLGIKLPLCSLATETYSRAVDSFGFDANHLKAVRLQDEDNDTYLQS